MAKSSAGKQNFADILKKANSKYQKAKKRVAEDPGPSFVEIPDSRYTAQLVSAKLGMSESSNRAQIAFGWKIVDGEYEGKMKTAFQGIETEDNLFFLGRDLERLGYELPDDLTDLPEILKDIEKTKPLAAIKLQTKGDFQNVYISKVFTSDDGDEEAEDETEEADEDVEEADEEETEEESDEEESDDAEEESEEESDDEEEESEDEDDEEDSDDEEEESDEESEDEDAEEGEADEDEVEITEGMRVQVETAKGREAGAIIEILEKEEKVRVKLDGGKVVRVGVDKIEVEPEKAAKKPAKKEEAKKPAKKPASAPAKKPVSKKPVAGKKKTKR